MNPYQPDNHDWRLIAAIQDGLPLSRRPYALIGAQAGLCEAEVIRRIQCLQDAGIIKRFGIVVHHRRLGYHANGMVVWDIADERLADIGQRFTGYDFVTLCYHRPRCLPDWPYNLFTMIHAQDRATVLANVEEMAQAEGLREIRREVLFSRRCFKQRGARYAPQPETQAVQAGGGG
jgi:DNA-binding Lrp family transcriptional regulator